MGRQLDPDRPLWEMYVVEGLAGGRTALIAKVHHAILDGVSGASMLAAFLDLNPRARVVAVPIGSMGPDTAARASAQMLRYAASSLSQQPARVLSTINAGVEAMADLGHAQPRVADRAKSSPPAFFSAPRTSLNGTVSNRKRFSSLSIPLDDAKLVRRAFGCTVNDVILAGVAGGLRRLLAGARGGVGTPAGGHGAGLDPPGGRGDGDALGNQLSAMLVSLATDVDDPVQRLDAIARIDEGGQGTGAAAPGPAGRGPGADRRPGLVSRVARAVAGTKLFDRVRPPFNVMVSGIKGPDFPLFCAGSRVVGHVPGGPDRRGRGTERDRSSPTSISSISGCWPAASSFPSSTTWPCRSTTRWASSSAVHSTSWGRPGEPHAAIASSRSWSSPSRRER